jgi:serine/threonine-protein kinase RsbW
MSNEPGTWKSQHDIPSELGAGKVVLDELLQKLDELGWPQRDVFGVHLAVEEALANAIGHGNQLDPTKQVHVVLSLSKTLLRIEIADEGNGFDPGSVPDPTDPDNLETASGRGIMLMRNFMSRVDFSQTGNRVIMEKECIRDG